ncbi:hypothetical protein [Kribbella sp. NPDC004536]|uniref:hypothetical protein n=1 Tax=Kribbella sp. NPDC004536 TaxID=3364106 RepID=UPI0036A7D243
MFPGAIDVLPATYLDQLGTIFTRFTTQHSGNVSYGVETATARYFCCLSRRRCWWAF